MEETIFPPSSNWFSPNIITCREDGSISYGSKNNIVILKTTLGKSCENLIIHNAHTQRVTSVVFSPSNCGDFIRDTVVSCSDDGFVKLWKIDTLSACMAHKSHWEEQKDLGKVICLDWSQANPNHIISVAENNSLVQWNVITNTTVKFSFQKLGPTVVACCPFNEKIVAVGGKTGQIYILNLSTSGDVIFKLRGHDNKINSLTWCPLPYNVFNGNDICEEFLLASACQDKEIYVWRVGSDGKCEVKFQVPTSSISKKDGGQYYVKSANSFSYTALFWADPYKIYFSSNFGELLYFDVKSFLLGNKINSNSGKKISKQSSFIKLGHCFHVKGLFAIAGSHKNFIIYDNNITEIKSNLKFKIESKHCTFDKNPNSDDKIEKNLKWEVVTTDSTSVLWTAGQDKKLVGCVLNSDQLKIVYNFHTVNGFVYCAVISPHDPNKIAIGVGDGMIRLWNLTEQSGDIQTFWQKVKDRVMALAWHPAKDGLLAYGTSEGRVGLIDCNTNKLPNVFKPNHSHPIYNLCWGPPFPTENDRDSSSRSDFHLYTVGNSMLSVYDPLKISSDPVNLSKIITFPCKKQTDVSWKSDYSVMAVGSEDGSICFVEPSDFRILHTFLPYKKMIYSIAWHPPSTSIDSGLSPYHGYFTSGSTDNHNEIRVFNYTKEENQVKIEQVATLKGHHGYIISVSWCPHLSGRLISNSGDGSVQIWDVFSQSPLVNFTPNEMPLFSVWSPINSDIVLTGCRNDLLCIWRISKQSEVAPSSSSKSKKLKKDKNIPKIAEKKIDSENNGFLEDKNKNGGIVGDVVLAEAQNVSKNEKESKMFSKAWKADVNDNVKNCYLLLREGIAENNQANYSLPFLCGEERYKELIKEEEELYKRTNKQLQYYELSLWNGNIKEVLEEKIKKGQLDDFLVSVAPMISLRTWQEACLSYSKTLAEKKLFRKAASYLIVCHKIYEAIELLVKADLYLEALSIARSRLPESDPLIKDIVMNYARWLFKNGAFLKACECYIYLGEYLEVAKICGKKSQPEYLELAALAARKCGSTDLENSEAMNAILKCFESDNLELGRRVCNDHYDLKHLPLMFNMYNLINQLDAGELVLEKDILSHVKEFSMSNIEFPSTSQQLYHKYMFYKNKRQMFIVVAQELSFASCSRETPNMVTHLVKALSVCYRYIQSSEGEVHPLYKLCTWLSPDGFLSENSYFTLTDNHLFQKVKSLRAFLCSALIRYLNNNLVTENILKYLNVIGKVTDGLLDIDSYKYFKNLIEIEICEKRLIKNRDKMVRNSFSNLSNSFSKNCAISCNSSNNLTTNNTVEIGESIENDTTEILHSESQTLKLNHQNINGDKIDGEKEGSIKVSESGELTNENSFENEESQCTKEELEEKITQDTELLGRLKSETENFEANRISSPNPIPIYFMLKKVLEHVSENEFAKGLLESVESKWKELN